MENTVFVILDVNFKVMSDMSVMGAYSSLDSAFKAAYDSVKNVSGKNIKVHGYSIEGEETTNNRLTNNNSLGSKYGISYDSNYGSYPCARIIMERTLSN